MSHSYVKQQAIDKIISGYIEMANHMDVSLDNLIQNDPRPEVFWQLTSIKGNMISWYPFSKKDKVIIYGDDFGVLKQAICDKVEDCVSCSLTECLSQSEYKYDFGIVNIHKYPGDSLPGYYEIKEQLIGAKKKLSERGILLVFCVYDEINFILQEAKQLGLTFYNIYDPLHIGLLMIEISKELIPDKNNKAPSEFVAKEKLLCKWTQTYGMPYFGPNFKAFQDDGIVIDEKMVAMDLLRKLKEVCDKNDLMLFPMYGTLLGAARSGTIIEGDDDIDIALFREDYDKLLEIKSEFEEPYFLQTNQNDECFYGGYTRLRNMNTTAINPQNWWVNCCEGIGIDIFPIDIGFHSQKKEKRKVMKIKHIQRFLYAKVYGYSAKFKDMNLFVWKGYKYIGKLFTKEKLCKLLDKALISGDNSKNEFYAIYTHYLGCGIPRYFEIKAFSKSTILKLEDIIFEVPFDWNIILRNLYGENYMEPIQENVDKKRHGFYSVNEPYNVYVKRFHGLHRLDSAEGKQIVLFGIDVLMKAYLKRYPDEKYKPSKLVRFIDEEYLCLKKIDGYNARDRYEKPVEKDAILGEIDVVDEEYFKEKDLSIFYPIICAIDVRAVELRLKKMGFKDYYVYWENREWMLNADLSVVRKDIFNLEKANVW